MLVSLWCHFSLIPDAEVVLLVQEIISEIPVLQVRKLPLTGMNVWFIRQSQTSLFLWFQQRNYYIKINHAMILHAILQHCGVPGGHFDDVLHILSGVKVGLISQIFHCRIKFLCCLSCRLGISLCLFSEDSSQIFIDSFKRKMINVIATVAFLVAEQPL